MESIDFDEIFRQISAFFLSDQFLTALDQSMAIIETEMERIEPEMQEWYDLHWEEQWSADSNDRWARQNLQSGWTFEDV